MADFQYAPISATRQKLIDDINNRVIPKGPDTAFLVKMYGDLVQHLWRNSGGPMETNPSDMLRLLDIASKLRK